MIMIYFTAAYMYMQTGAGDIFVILIRFIEMARVSLLLILLFVYVSESKFEISGFGGSAPASVFHQWGALYAANRKAVADINVAYRVVNNDKVLDSSFAANSNEANFASIERMLTAEERNEYPNLVMFPVMGR